MIVIIRIILIITNNINNIYKINHIISMEWFKKTAEPHVLQQQKNWFKFQSGSLKDLIGLKC